MKFLILAALLGPIESNATISVNGPDPASAKAMMRLASEYRRSIAVEWLGAEVPPSIGQCSIHIGYKPNSRGQFWPARDGDRSRHMMWVYGPSVEQMSADLKHEMCHLVFESRYPWPGNLPPWIMEGTASRYDNETRKKIRANIVKWWKQTGNWPQLKQIVNADRWFPNDYQAYTASELLVDYLMSRRSIHVFRKFMSDSRAGFLPAIKTHYRIDSHRDLQSAWQQWVIQCR